MGKKGIFEYVNLQKQNLTSRDGKPYARYIVVSDQNMETKKIKDKLAPFGFQWNGREWWMFSNRLTQEAVDGLKAINAELETQGGQTGNLEDFTSQLEQLRSEIQNSSLPAKTKTELEAKIEQYIEDIANATDERAAGMEFQRFLDFSHKFHNYSFSNIMLIYLQDKNASKVAGEGAWNKKFNRKIIDKNKAISIWCANKFYSNPKTGKLSQYTLDQQKRDNDYIAKVEAGQLASNRDELEAIQTRKNVAHIKFDPCNVYDIANTTGDPLPDKPNWKGTYDDREDAKALFSIAKKSLEKSGIQVTQDPATADEGGWSRKGQINVSQGATGSGAASTIFHEWAHDLLHQKGGKFENKALEYFEKKGDLNYAQIKQIKEIQAETVSAVLCKHYGITAEHHPTYMALWQSQGRLSSKQLIKENISTITDVSNFIIHQIDVYKDEFDAARANMQTQPAQQPQA
jgi:hypothetical protein